jgi:hypothetical protein
MRFIFYGMAGACFTLACIYASFSGLAGGYLNLAFVLVVCGALIAGGGYFVARKTSRKCARCGERTERLHSTCQFCGTDLSTAWSSLQAEPLGNVSRKR